jgi:predicted nucleic acid-binding protein
MNRIVVDTDVASYILNWHSSASKYVEALRGATLVLSFMSIAELRAGAVLANWGPRRLQLLEQFIEGFGVVYPDDAMCTSWAFIRARARAAGRGLSPQDAWIASTAISMNAELVTNNHSDFANIESLRLLKI